MGTLKIKGKIVISIISYCFLLGDCSYLYAWGNKQTHPELTDKATQVSSVIDSYLKTQLDCSQGLNTHAYSWAGKTHKSLTELSVSNNQSVLGEHIKKNLLLLAS